MQTAVYDQNWDKVGEVELASTVFEVKPNNDLMYQVTTSQMSNRRQRIAHTKDRAQVRGGGKKPWKQKGTGRARHGSIRSPIWKGGGVTFGPSKDKIFKKKINQKMARRAVAIALSEKIKNGSLFVVDKIALPGVKTKEAFKIVKGLSKIADGFHVGNSVLLISNSSDADINKSIRNIKSVETMEGRNLNALDLLSFKYTVVVQNALETIVKNFGK